MNTVNVLVNTRPSTRLDSRAVGRLTGVRQAGQQPQTDRGEHVSERMNIHPIRCASTRLDQWIAYRRAARSIEG
ncbi:hypothetical protein ACIA98_00380 [Streptomyces sp. NPDC051366]|uniref:hypothetical protein n=1 Tax=Streptomyces sp. NPDC051366 TaxID=3365652 RepID=UPI00378EE0F6